jgi:hypothetical protein
MDHVLSRSDCRGPEMSLTFYPEAALIHRRTNRRWFLPVSAGLRRSAA